MDNQALIASRAGDLSQLKQRLDHGIDVNARDESGLTLLHHAAGNGQVEIVECLLQNGADVLLTTEKNNTALHIAVTRSDEALVRVILENVARGKLRKLLDARTKATGTAALHLAAKQNSHAVVSMLLEYGANFDIENNAGERPVDLATSEDLRRLLRLIDACFAKARRDGEMLHVDLALCVGDDLTSVTGCRNNEGRTLFQVLVLRCKVVEALLSMPSYLLMRMRLRRSHDDKQRALRASSCQDDIDELAERARDCRRLWLERVDDISSNRRLLVERKVTLSKFVSRVGEATMQKALELLLAYRRLEVKDKSLRANAPIESLEEVLQLLGFETEQLHAAAGQSDSQYQRVPAKGKKAVHFQGSFFMHVKFLISTSANCLAFSLTSAQMYRAVVSDDRRKMQQLMMNDKAAEYAQTPDESMRTILCHAAENGSKKMIKLLLKSGVKVARDDEGALSPIHLAVNGGRAKIVKLLLEKADAINDLPELIDSRWGFECTALHAAAMKGDVDMVKALLRYGATYSILDVEGRTPLDVSTDEEVSEIFKLVESCFDDAKKANAELVYKLKEMPRDLFLAVAGTKNEQGQTLAVVANKANAKSIAGIVLRMIREAKVNKK